MGPVAFLVPGLRVALRATKPEFRCVRGDPLTAQLRARRRGLGLAVADAAALVGDTRRTLGMWENGRKRRSAPSGRAIAAFLGCGQWLRAPARAVRAACSVKSARLDVLILFWTRRSQSAKLPSR